MSLSVQATLVNISSRVQCTVQIYYLAYLKRNELFKRAAGLSFHLFTLGINRGHARLLKHLNGGAACMLFLNEPISVGVLSSSTPLIGFERGDPAMGVASC